MGLLASWGLTYLAVSLSAVFFRSPTLGVARSVLEGLVLWQGGDGLALRPEGIAVLLLCVVGAHAIGNIAGLAPRRAARSPRGRAGSGLRARVHRGDRARS